MYHTVLSDIINTLRLTGLFNYSCIFICTICWDILTLLWPVLSLVSFLTSHLLYSLYLCIPTPPSIIILLHSHSLPWLFPTMFGLSPLQIALSLCSPVHYGHSVSPHLSWEAVFVVQSLSHVQLFATPWTPANQASLSFTISRVCWNSCPLSQWCRPTISSSVTSFSSLPLIFPSIRVFSNELALLIRWPKYWSFRFSISPSSKYSGFISFRIDWFDLLAAQETLKSPLHHKLKLNSLVLQYERLGQIHEWLDQASSAKPECL